MNGWPEDSALESEKADERAGQWREVFEPFV